MLATCPQIFWTSSAAGVDLFAGDGPGRAGAGWDWDELEAAEGAPPPADGWG